VHVTFSDGSAGEYDLVVGADGINSTVRRLAVDDEPPAYGGQMVWRAIAPIRPRGLTKLQFLLGDGCFFGLCPVGDGGTYGFANTSEPRFHDEPEGRLERVRARFASFGSIVHEYLGALDSDDSLHCSAIEWLEREAWSNGRVVLIGDAAHAGSPMMGQGGCLAMEDAYVLAEELSNAPSVESALASYIARRAPRVKWVREHSRAVGESLRLPSAVRNGVLRQRGDQLLQDRYRPLVAEA
jgi:2-polyprenyl-6-methoxyphenol hydroxylase-like FAD-dependent oxidoreductase